VRQEPGTSFEERTSVRQPFLNEDGSQNVATQEVNSADLEPQIVPVEVVEEQPEVVEEQPKAPAEKKAPVKKSRNPLKRNKKKGKK